MSKLGITTKGLPEDSQQFKDTNRDMAKSPKGKALSIMKRVGSFLDRQFIEPSRRVNAIQNAKMKSMDSQAKSGEFN